MTTVVIVIEVAGQTPGVPGQSRVFPYSVVDGSAPLCTVNLNDTTGVDTFFWEFLDKPTGSSVVFSDPTAAEPTFTPDQDESGTYLISCSINDGESRGLIGLAFTTPSLSLRKLAAGEGPQFDAVQGWVEAYNDMLDKVDGDAEGFFVKVSSNDSTPNYLEDKLDAGSGISLTTINEGADEKVQISAPGSTSDEKVKVSSDDTTAGYIEDKIESGAHTKVRTSAPAGNEKFHIDLGDDATLWVERGATDILSAANVITTLTAAKALTPGGSALSATNRATVKIPAGIYDFGDISALAPPFQLDATYNYIDIVGEGEPVVNYEGAIFPLPDKVKGPATRLIFQSNAGPPLVYLNGVDDFGFYGVSMVADTYFGGIHIIQSAAVVPTRFVLKDCFLNNEVERVGNISAITQAFPPVVTSDDTNVSDGEPVYIKGVIGMTELNGRWFTVAGKTATTYQLQGVDATGYTAYTSGGEAHERSWCADVSDLRWTIENCVIAGHINSATYCDLVDATIKDCLILGQVPNGHMTNTSIVDSRIVGKGLCTGGGKTADVNTVISGSHFNSGICSSGALVYGLIEDCVFYGNVFDGMQPSPVTICRIRAENVVDGMLMLDATAVLEDSVILRNANNPVIGVIAGAVIKNCTLQNQVGSTAPVIVNAGAPGDVDITGCNIGPEVTFDAGVRLLWGDRGNNVLSQPHPYWSEITVAQREQGNTNAAAFLEAIALAATMTPMGSALSTTNRVTIKLPPGRFDFGTDTSSLAVLEANWRYLDIVGVGQAGKENWDDEPTEDDIIHPETVFYGQCTGVPMFMLDDDTDIKFKNIKFENTARAAVFGTNEDQCDNIAFENCTFVRPTDLTITGISKATYAIITTSEAHGIISAQLAGAVRFDGIVGMTELNGRSYKIYSIPSTTSIGIALDTTGFNTYVSGGTAKAGKSFHGIQNSGTAPKFGGLFKNCHFVGDLIPNSNGNPSSGFTGTMEDCSVVGSAWGQSLLGASIRNLQTLGFGCAWTGGGNIAADSVVDDVVTGESFMRATSLYGILRRARCRYGNIGGALIYGIMEDCEALRAEADAEPLDLRQAARMTGCTILLDPEVYSTASPFVLISGGALDAVFDNNTVDGNYLSAAGIEDKIVDHELAVSVRGTNTINGRRVTLNTPVVERVIPPFDFCKVYHCDGGSSFGSVVIEYTVYTEDRKNIRTGVLRTSYSDEAPIGSAPIQHSFTADIGDTSKITFQANIDASGNLDVKFYNSTVGRWLCNFTIKEERLPIATPEPAKIQMTIAGLPGTDGTTTWMGLGNGVHILEPTMHYRSDIGTVDGTMTSLQQGERWSRVAGSDSLFFRIKRVAGVLVTVTSDAQLGWYGTTSNTWSFSASHTYETVALGSKAAWLRDAVLSKTAVLNGVTFTWERLPTQGIGYWGKY